MSNLSIKNVPSEVVVRLRNRVNGESFETANVGGVRQGHKPIEMIAAEHKARLKQPIRTGDRSVDMIRADRDAR